MIVPTWLKLLVIGLNMAAFISLVFTADRSTKVGKFIHYTSIFMMFLDILVILRHAGVLDFH
jgi:hypothetical protein